MKKESKPSKQSNMDKFKARRVKTEKRTFGKKGNKNA
jgi:hypothetical protein